MSSIQRFCLFILLFFSTQAACQSPQESMQSKLSRLLSSYEDWGFSGTVLVARGSEVVFEQGYGYANRATRDPNTPGTRFDFASIAKTFTGAAILALEADGLLDVTDSLETYIGSFSDARKSSAMVHHLATHTAGLAHRSQSQLAYGPDRLAYIESMKEAPFETPPGKNYRYSNAGTSLLAALVESISEVPYERFIQTRFFEPLGLTSARFIPEVDPEQTRLALGYQDETRTPAPTIYDNGWNWGLIGSTGITATVRDIYLWYEALYKGDLLPPVQRQKLFDASEEEAYGWHTDRDEADRLRIHKGGGLPAMQSQIRAYPESDIVIVWAHNNTTRNWRRALNEGITAIALGDPFGYVPEVDEAHTPGSRPLPEEGVYTTSDGTMLELTAEDGELLLGRNGFGLTPSPLRAGQTQNWILFSPEDLIWLSLSETTETSLRAILGPEAQEYDLTRTTMPLSKLLDQPEPAHLERVRGYVAALQESDTGAIHKASLYQPLAGSLSLDDWNRQARFLAGNIGPEARLIEEAWALRNGTWRYWRTYEAESGAQVMLRFQLTTRGEIAGFGMNPAQSEPETAEKRTIY